MSIDKSNQIEKPLTRKDIAELRDEFETDRLIGITNRWKLQEKNMRGIDLSGYDLSGVDLTRSDLSEANLQNANLRFAIMNRTILNKASLRGANLNGAELRLSSLIEADLRETDLIEANLNQANLYKANLEGADLYKADLTGANLSRTILNNEALTSSQIGNIAKANPSNIQEVAAAQLDLINQYYKNALDQSQRSFWFALLFAALGTVLIFAGIIFLFFQKPSSFSFISLGGGAIIDAVASLIFYLYARTTNQLAIFQRPLDRLGRFLIANSACENIGEDLRDDTRAELVKIIAKSSTLNTDRDYTENVPSPRILRTRSASKRK